MYCGNCGSEVPQEAKACPRCGTLTSTYSDNAGAGPGEPTYISGTPQQIPSTDYSSQPYDSYNPYSVAPPPNPNEVPLQAPPPPPPVFPPPTPRRGSRNMLIAIIAGLLLLFLLGSGIYEVIAHSIPATPTPAAQITPTTQITATSTTSSTLRNPYPPNSGTLALNDPLTDNSEGYSWTVGNPYQGATCAFTAGAFHISADQTGIVPCTTATTSFSNFAFQVQMTIIKGAGGGIVFRVDGPKYYYCYIHQDGTYGCSLYVDSTSTPKILTDGSSTAIKTGLNQPNVIAVVANGSHLDLYVNQQNIANVNDNAYSQGLIGFVAENDNGPTEAVFSNAQVWTL